MGKNVIAYNAAHIIEYNSLKCAFSFCIELHVQLPFADGESQRPSWKQHYNPVLGLEGLVLD